MATRIEATVADLYRAEGKAELVDGKLVLMPLTGARHGIAAGGIYRNLDDYRRATGGGFAFADNVGFLVSLPRRRSFSPDAAFWVGQLPAGGEFLSGAPIFAAEVRSEDDYGPAAEAAMARKRADYFAAGTLVVWDVDVLRDRQVRVFRASDPERPTVFRRGERADAEPALPGWSMLVDDLFAP